MMTTNDFETCIIGQGLAGTTLAWALNRTGQRVAIIDRDEQFTSSRIAAGLITPVTGKRFVKSWHFDEFWPAAVEFYRSIEAETEAEFFTQKNSVRLFANREEQELFNNKANRDFPELVHSSEKLINESCFDAPDGGFEMVSAARLNVARYLDVSREAFTRQECHFIADIDPNTDLQLEDNAVAIPTIGVKAQKVIFCQGFSGANNPWFQAVPFDSAKGEILTVRIPGFNEQRTVHRGVWLAAIGDDLYRLGATYDREHLDCTPTTAGRDELCSRLKKNLRVPFEVVEHNAAVRPIIVGRKPAIGFHPQFPQLGYFNGLGSKGSLQAPWLAEHFASVISGNTTLLPDLDVSRHFNRP